MRQQKRESSLESREDASMDSLVTPSLSLPALPTVSRKVASGSYQTLPPLEGDATLFDGMNLSQEDDALADAESALEQATIGSVASEAPDSATNVIRALEPVSPESRSLSRSIEDVTQRLAITLVPATRPPSTLPATAPSRHVPSNRRRTISGAVIWTLVLAVFIGVVSAVTPLGRQIIAAPFAQNASGAPWQTAANAKGVLGLGGGAGPGVNAPGSAGIPVKLLKTKATPPPAPSVPPVTSGVSPAPFSPWPPSDPFMAPPGYSSFGMNDPNGYYSWDFGQCTWWAQYKRQDENLANMGNAGNWAYEAPARGLSTGTWPVVGATVVFQPGVEGASGVGHVAHVEVVYPDGWFLISEMNFYWNGGGWGRVDYRYAHTGGGVSFIY